MVYEALFNFLQGGNDSVGLEENSHDSNDDDNQEIIINLPNVHNSDPEEQVRRRQIEKELESRLEKKGKHFIIVFLVIAVLVTDMEIYSATNE